MTQQSEETSIRNMIKLMWGLYIAACIMCSVPGTRLLGVMADLISIILAVGLILRPEPHARKAGWWRLKFEIVLLVITLFAVWLFRGGH